jgi:hypothetical protein
MVAVYIEESLQQQRQDAIFCVLALLRLFRVTWFRFVQRRDAKYCVSTWFSCNYCLLLPQVGPQELERLIGALLVADLLGR